MRTLTISFSPSERNEGSSVKLSFTDLHELFMYLHDTYERDWQSVYSESPDLVSAEIDLAYAEYQKQLEAENDCDDDIDQNDFDVSTEYDFFFESAYQVPYTKNRGKRAMRRLHKRREKRHIRDIEELLEKKALKEKRDFKKRKRSTIYGKRFYSWQKHVRRLVKKGSTEVVKLKPDNNIPVLVNVHFHSKHSGEHCVAIPSRAFEKISDLYNLIGDLFDVRLSSRNQITCYFKSSILGII